MNFQAASFFFEKLDIASDQIQSFEVEETPVAPEPAAVAPPTAANEPVPVASQTTLAAAASSPVPKATQAIDLDAVVREASSKNRLDPDFVSSVIRAESNFKPRAVSKKGAQGLMQLMPKTARELKVKNPFDPQQNVDAGVRHLKYLLENYNGDVNLTLAAYNAGEGAVRRSAGVPHYSETQDYVRKITHLYYGGFDLSQTGISRDPVKVQRDERGVLYISNTE